MANEEIDLSKLSEEELAERYVEALEKADKIHAALLAKEKAAIDQRRNNENSTSSGQ